MTQERSRDDGTVQTQAEVTHHVGTIPTTAYTNLKARLLRKDDRRLADIRIFRVDNSGRHRPTGRGVRLDVNQLPELRALVDRMIGTTSQEPNE